MKNLGKLEKNLTNLNENKLYQIETKKSDIQIEKYNDEILNNQQIFNNQLCFCVGVRPSFH
jgi:hypothetical protein